MIPELRLRSTGTPPIENIPMMLPYSRHCGGQPPTRRPVVLSKPPQVPAGMSQSVTKAISTSLTTAFQMKVVRRTGSLKQPHLRKAHSAVHFVHWSFPQLKRLFIGTWTLSTVTRRQHFGFLATSATCATRPRPFCITMSTWPTSATPKSRANRPPRWSGKKFRIWSSTLCSVWAKLKMLTTISFKKWLKRRRRKKMWCMTTIWWCP